MDLEEHRDRRLQPREADTVHHLQLSGSGGGASVEQESVGLGNLDDGPDPEACFEHTPWQRDRWR